MTSEIANFKGIKQPKDKIDQYIQFYKNPLGFMLLTGNNGRGKSYVAKAFYNHAIYPLTNPQKDWSKAFFANQSDLNMMWQTYGSKYHDPLALYDEIKDTKLLIIDDLGTRKPSDAFHDFLYALLDYRYEKRHSFGTIITTNLNSETLTEMFSNAIKSRIASGIVQKFIDGVDRRVCDF